MLIEHLITDMEEQMTMIQLKSGTSKLRYLLNTTTVLMVSALSACSSSSDPATTSSDDETENSTAITNQVTMNPTLRFTDCPFNVSEMSSELRCGVLETYENYENTGTDARMIELAFGIVPATITPAAPDPIVIFSGGPGISGLADFALGVDLESYSRNRDLILVDQRGTGYSSPFLSCDLSDDFELTEAGSSCIAGFEQQGVDLSQYRSAVIAEDFKVLREALEIPQWNVYGESFGPIPGILYADLDSAGVRSVIFDSSTNNQVDIGLADTAAPLDFITELSIQCAAETRCAARLPDLRSAFVDTFRSLSNEPWIGDIPDGGNFEFDGLFLFELIADLNPTEFPGVLEIFATRDTELLLRILQASDDGNGEIESEETLDAIRNIESRLFANLMGGVVQCAAIDAENFNSAIIPTIEQWPDDLLDVSRELVGNGFPSFCNSGLVSIEQDLSQREPRALNVPALILGGVLDSNVSLHQVRQFTESFGSPRLAIVPRGGHVVGFPTSDLDSCVRGIATAFLKDPENAPEMNCLAENVQPFLFGEEFIGVF